MRIVKIKGGIGNQMFQYSFAKLLEKETKDTVKLDFQDYNYRKKDKIRIPRLLNFNISLEESTFDELRKITKFPKILKRNMLSYKISIFIEKTINKLYYFENNRKYTNIKEIIKYNYYDGYWQSYKYVDSIINEIKNDFTSKIRLSEKTMIFKEEISNQNSVFIGVRKGDYTKNKKTMKHYGSFSSDYYINSIKIIQNNVSNPVFYVFSDDIEWAKDNINWGGYKVKFREKEDQTNDFEELILMSSCKNAIIVNSTFNWWGARLINNPSKIVVCPENWFFDNKPIDIIPEDWIRLKNVF